MFAFGHYRQETMGSRNTHQGAEKVYAAAEFWVDHALRKDDSLFTPGTSIWSSLWIKELRDRYLDKPDVSKDGFYIKLERQLAGSRPEVYQLTAEMLYFHFLVVSDETMKHSTKKNRLYRVLGWSGKNTEIPADRLDGLARGLAATGQAFNTYRPAHVGWLIEFVDQWKRRPSQERDRLLKEPWDFKDSLRFTPTGKLFDEYSEGQYRAQHRALLHLVFPDTFEVILSLNQKKQITDAYADLVSQDSEDLDRRLAQIHQCLETKHQRDIDFYDDDIRQEWDPQWKSDLKNLATKLLLPAGFLEKIDTLLKDKKQVIFQGPPGTGKTYVAQKLAAHLAGSEERVTLVQFHPSYAYEDFVQGFRPTLTDGGQPGFELTDGPLLTAAKRARDEEDKDHFLVIDEINRGNLAKVLGELYFLLEYRNQKMRLQYQTEDDEEFSLPENLYVIGTMNTADRSIALVDLALRRRFHFVEFHPDNEPIKGLLRKWLDRNAPGMEWVADVVERANRKLADDRHVAIGPSYFMVKNGVLDKAAVERIWKHNVLPYIEEHLFGSPDGLDEWKLDTLQKAKAKSDESGAAEDKNDQATDAPG